MKFKTISISQELIDKLEEFRLSDAEKPEDILRRLLGMKPRDIFWGRFKSAQQRAWKGITRSKYPFDMLRVGEEVLVPWSLAETKEAVHGALHQYQKRSGKEFSWEARSDGLKVIRKF